ncbi:MAG: hypothetical protein ACJ8EY_10090 [Sphingomicrobium sp.]
MRSNSGDDQGRNNLHDPTLRDRELGREVEKKHPTQTTEMGSDTRKTGQKGAG